MAVGAKSLDQLQTLEVRNPKNYYMPTGQPTGHGTKELSCIFFQNQWEVVDSTYLIGTDDFLL